MHAFREFIAEHAFVESNWYQNSNYLAFLSLKDEAELLQLLNKAKKLNIKCSLFKEPDLNYEITAIVLAPSLDSKKLCANIGLMGKKK